MSKPFTFDRSVLVPHTPSQIYALVDDIANYPQYLPNCNGGGVDSRTVVATEPHTEIVKGWIGLGFMGVKQRFSTDNLHTKDSKIAMKLLDGPFDTLTGEWQFTPVGDRGCKVSLSMQWAFNNAFMTMAVGAAFSKVADQLLDSFVAEADKRYRPQA